MAVFSSLPDDQLDLLLSGQGEPSLASGLDQVMRVLRTDADRHGAPPMSAALRAQVADPFRSVAPLRRRVLIGAFSGLALGGAAMGVAGAQDVLPAPIQDATASVAGVLGFDLPRSPERNGRTSGDDGDADGSGQTDDPDGAITPEGPGTSTPEPSAPPAADPSPRSGPPATTPGGAVPADPGTPGDQEPATPATPAAGNGAGSDNGTANTTANGNHASEIGKSQGTGTSER